MVVRFYQSCSSPPRLAVLLLLRLLLLPPPLLPRLLPLPRPLLPCQLFAKLFANVRARCAPLGPSQLSGHRWTSTWDLPSSVCTAGLMRIWEPQAGAHKNIFFKKSSLWLSPNLSSKSSSVWLALFLYHVDHPNKHHQKIRLTEQISKSPLVLIAGIY